MKKTLLLLSILLLLVVPACNLELPQTKPTAGATPTQPIISTVELPQTQAPQVNLPETEANVPRVKVEDAKAAFDSGKAIIVDVRSAQAFAAEHIKGAISIPLGTDITLEKDQWIITYCT